MSSSEKAHLIYKIMNQNKLINIFDHSRRTQRYLPLVFYASSVSCLLIEVVVEIAHMKLIFVIYCLTHTCILYFHD